MGPGFLYHRGLDDRRIGFEEALHDSNARRVTLTVVPRHLPRPYAVTDGWRVDEVKLVVWRKPQPQLVVDPHPEGLIEPAPPLEAVSPHQGRGKADEVGFQQVPGNP